MGNVKIKIGIVQGNFIHEFDGSVITTQNTGLYKDGATIYYQNMENTFRGILLDELTQLFGIIDCILDNGRSGRILLFPTEILYPVRVEFEDIDDVEVKIFEGMPVSFKTYLDVNKIYAIHVKPLTERILGRTLRNDLVCLSRSAKSETRIELAENEPRIPETVEGKVSFKLIYGEDGFRATDIQAV